MENNKLFNLIAGISGAASLAMPAIGSSYYGFVYWMFGSLVEEGKVFNILEEVKPDALAMASLTIVAAIMIAAGTAMFFLSLVPKLNMALFTMLGWIIMLAGCGVFLIFGFGADIDEPIFLWRGIYPLGVIASFASGGLGLVSWILQTRK
ncbi:MAG: hypothetical protein Q6373_017155 [Candidatus Sigynarchaeota archaeon]